MAAPKSLMQFICETIDEVLPQGSAITGRDLYLRGWERYEADVFEKERNRSRRQLEAALPLFTKPK